jgi:hypothetical protein
MTGAGKYDSISTRHEHERECHETSVDKRRPGDDAPVDPARDIAGDGRVVAAKV